MVHGKYKCPSIEEKVNIINDVIKSSFRKVAQERNIPLKTLYRYVNQKEEIFKIFDSDECSKNNKLIRFSKYHDVEDALVLWIKQSKNKRNAVSVQKVRDMANFYANKLGHEDFECNEGWIYLLKKHRRISFDKIPGELIIPQSLDDSKLWKQTILQSIMDNYSQSDIFSVYEAGLFYKLLPNNTLAYKNEICSKGTKPEERVTILVGCNINGSEKLPLIIIGSETNPFLGKEYLRSENYHFNSKSWMTQEIFTQWLRKLDWKMTKAGRKITIFLDTCTSHPDLKLISINLVFLPPHATKEIDPCDVGLIKSLKCLYRRKLVTKYLFEKEDFNLDLATAVEWLDFLWSRVKSVDNVVEGNDEMISMKELFELLNVRKKRVDIISQDYINIDEWVITEEDLSDDEIADLIIEKNNSVDQKQNEIEIDVEEEESDYSDVELIEDLPFEEVNLEPESDMDKSVELNNECEPDQIVSEVILLTDDDMETSNEETLLQSPTLDEALAYVNGLKRYCSSHQQLNDAQTKELLNKIEMHIVANKSN